MIEYEVQRCEYCTMNAILNQINSLQRDSLNQEIGASATWYRRIYSTLSIDFYSMNHFPTSNINRPTSMYYNF